MMTMEEKLQVLAKAVGVTNAKTMHLLGDYWLILPERLTCWHKNLSFNPYNKLDDYRHILSELRCVVNHSLSENGDDYILTTNLAVKSVSDCDVYFSYNAIESGQDFVGTLRGSVLDLLVEVLTASANTAGTVQSTKP
jgi:hypothetical protein